MDKQGTDRTRALVAHTATTGQSNGSRGGSDERRMAGPRRYALGSSSRSPARSAPSSRDQRRLARDRGAGARSGRASRLGSGRGSGRGVRRGSTLGSMRGSDERGRRSGTGSGASSSKSEGRWRLLPGSGVRVLARPDGRSRSGSSSRLRSRLGTRARSVAGRRCARSKAASEPGRVRRQYWRLNQSRPAAMSTSTTTMKYTVRVAPLSPMDDPCATVSPPVPRTHITHSLSQTPGGTPHRARPGHVR